jgi:SAM-dependent methyltransferase
MDNLRKVHNDAKRKLIQRNVPRGSLVLDVGCGRGGDLHKWKDCRVWGMDPDVASIEEAKKRAKECGYDWATFAVGDVHFAPRMLFDVICYNFSLQYVFKSADILKSSLRQIAERIRIGGVFIGIVPDAKKIINLPTDWSDALGNTIKRGPHSNKCIQVGNMILVNLADGPYYANGPIPEPLCYKEFLIEEASEWFELESWTNMVRDRTGLITDIYSKFIFRRV